MEMEDELLEILNRVYRAVKENFIEINEVEELWTMPPKGYDASQQIRDDCDGFCLACRMLLRKWNIPSRLVYCEIDRKGHLVVEVQGWILDNRQKVVVANTLLREYDWLRISGFEAGEEWREISNFGL